MTWASTAWAPGAWAPEAWQTGDPPEPPDDLRRPLTAALIPPEEPSVVGDDDWWRLELRDADGPVAPDGPVTWEVRTLRVAEEVAQPKSAAVSTGVYELMHVPDRAVSYSVKARAIVRGIPQATVTIQRVVQP